MIHLRCVEALSTRRFFKSYLIEQGLTTESDLTDLANNLSAIKQFRLHNVMDCAINNLDFGRLSDYRFTALDLFQGIYYLTDQGLLQGKQGPLVVGTWLDRDSKSMQEISSRLGQYLYVLMSQSADGFKRLGQPKELMRAYA